MTKDESLHNKVRAQRLARGWSQEDLALRAGISRAGVGAIETGRLVPSAATALKLAAIFGCRVEDLFHFGEGTGHETLWAWEPQRQPCRYWCATVGGRTLRYPVESTNQGVAVHDGVFENGHFQDRARIDPEDTLVIACCDPAVALLARELQRAGVRLLALQRPSRVALELLGQGLIHAAGVHLASRNDQQANIRAAREELRRSFSALRMARWWEGLAASPSLGLKSFQAALRSKLRWVGRETGSVVSELLAELLRKRHQPQHVAYSHRGVAECVQSGWADLGICLRLPSDEAGLDFFALREDDYDLCYLSEHEGDPRIQALVTAVRSVSYRQSLAMLPGYNTAETGQLQSVAWASPTA